MSDHQQTQSKGDPPKKSLPKHDEPKKASLNPEAATPNHSKKESLKPETGTLDHTRNNSLKQEVASQDHLKKEFLKSEHGPQVQSKKESLQPDTGTHDHAKNNALKPETIPGHSFASQDHSKKDSSKQEPLTNSIPKKGSLKPEAADQLKNESLKREAARADQPNIESLPETTDPPKKESMKQIPPKPLNAVNLPSSTSSHVNTSTGKSQSPSKHEVIKIRMKVKRSDHHRVQHGDSGSSLNSRKSVHFRDGRKHDLSDDDGSMVDVEVSVNAVARGLVDVAYFETLMQDKELWVDHNYLSGFRMIFSADEVWLQEVYCIPCGLNTTYQITTKDDKPVFFIKKSQRAFPSWFKSLVCCSTTSCYRNGFKIKLFSTTGTRLVTFIRKTHMCVTQLDIVETYYGKEEVYIGRIERSANGYILRDKFQDDIYRVLQLPTSERSFTRMIQRSKHLFEGITPRLDDGNCCSVRQKEMKIFRSDTKEVVGRLAYLKKGAGRRFFSGCSVSSKSGFFCSPDMGTNAKVLLMGVLFFLMHSGYEKHVDLPLGSDAAGHTIQSSASSTSLDPQALSDASLDVLMKK